MAVVIPQATVEGLSCDMRVDSSPNVGILVRPVHIPKVALSVLSYYKAPHK